MSYVNHKTNNPGGNDLYGYAFLTLPNPKSPTNPKGVTIDEKIMPARDIHDLSASTNTWKELHGVDLYFLQEGAEERRFAYTQLTYGRSASSNYRCPGTWQNQWQMTEGWIASYYWKNVCGRYDEVGQTTTYSGIGRCYKEGFIDISSVSQLPDEITNWPGGAEIGLYIPAGNRHASRPCYEYPEDLIAPLDQSMMISHLSEFESGSPLSAQSVRKLYKDMERLKYYVLNGPIDIVETQTNPYRAQAYVDAWRKTDSGYLDWNIIEDHPQGYYYNDIIIQTSRAFGTPTYQGMFEIWQASAGAYFFPYCGKQGSGAGTYDQIYGQEVAVYVVLRLERKIPSEQSSSGQWLDDKYGFYKITGYNVNRSYGFVILPVAQIVAAGYKLINKYNAEIPHQIPPNYRSEYYTRVQIQRIFSVCKLTDRTDTTQLNWNKRPQ